MAAEGSAFGSAIPVNTNGPLAADKRTLQTEIPHIFAAGDATTGASDIRPGPPRRTHDRSLAQPRAPDRLRNGRPPAAGRQAEGARPSDAIHLDVREQIEEVDVGAVVVATGYKLFTADAKPEYGFGRYNNVITGMQMDPLLAPTRPFNTVLRPGDGKVPERIAYILCTGSRDEAPGPDGRGGVDNPLCSRFCCMYSIKQNQLVMGALPLAEVTVHYMDIRALGKRYDEFYESAKSMGATYVRDIRQGSCREGHRKAARQPDPSLRGHRTRRGDRRSRVRHGRPGNRLPTKPRSRAPLRGRRRH
jgi:hypothetical protein